MDNFCFGVHVLRSYKFVRLRGELAYSVNLMISQWTGRIWWWGNKSGVSENLSLIFISVLADCESYGRAVSTEGPSSVLSELTDLQLKNKVWFFSPLLNTSALLEFKHHDFHTSKRERQTDREECQTCIYMTCSQLRVNSSITSSEKRSIVVTATPYQLSLHNRAHCLLPPDL